MRAGRQEKVDKLTATLFLLPFTLTAQHAPATSIGLDSLDEKLQHFLLRPFSRFLAPLPRLSTLASRSGRRRSCRLLRCLEAAGPSWVGQDDGRLARAVFIISAFFAIVPEFNEENPISTLQILQSLVLRPRRSWRKVPQSRLDLLTNEANPHVDR